MAKTLYDPNTLEQALVNAEWLARRYGSAYAVCQTKRTNGEKGYWAWGYQDALANFGDMIVAVSLDGEHPAAKIKFQQDDAQTMAGFTDWNQIA